MTIESYHEMIRTGALTDDDPIELLEGELVVRPPKTPRHSATKGLLAELLGPLCDGWHWRLQQAVTLTDSEPEPDVVIATGSPRDYVARHPGARDVGLLVEVCASSQYRDRVQKKRIYSRAGIEPYWIVEVDNRRIEVYTRPDGLGDYAAVEVVEPGGWVDVVVGGHLAGRLAVNDILPTAAVPQ